MDIANLFKRDFNLQKEIIYKNYRKNSLEARKESLINARRQSRDTLIFKNRKIDLNHNMSPVTPIISKSGNNEISIKKEVGNSKRLEMLKQWKEKKMKLKQEEKKHSKPIFKVFHVDQRIGLPDLEKVNKEIKGKPIKPLKNEFSNRHKFIAPIHVQPIFFNIPTILDKPKVNNNTSNITKNILSRTNSNISIKKLPNITNNAKKMLPNTSAAIKKVKSSITSNSKKACLPVAGPSTRTATSTTRKSNLKKPITCEINPRLKTIDEGTNNSLLSREKEMHEKSVVIIDRLDDLVVYAESEVTMKTPVRKHSPSCTSRYTQAHTPRPPSSRKSHAKKNSCVLCLDSPISNTKSKTPTTKTTTPKTKTPKSKRKSGRNDMALTVSIDNVEFMDNLNKTRTPEITPKSVKHTPVYISPFVTITRGKDSARKEYKIRKSTGGTFMQVADGRNFTDTTNPRAGAEYFERILENEITRIESICEKWENFKVENEIAEETSDMINVATGQSRLLISKKIEQFRGLINQCKLRAFEEKPVTYEDLHGFWDLIYKQILDLDKRFDNLERLKENNWEEILSEKKVIIKKARGRPKKSAATSLKAHMKDAKNNNKQDLCQSLTIEPNTPENVKIASPIKGNSSRKSLRLSLLKIPTLRRVSSPGLTIMKITQAIKSGDGFTPTKSILKTDLTKSANRQTKSVLFVENVPKRVIFSTEDKENNAKQANFNNSNEIIVISPMPVRRSKRLNKA